MIDLRQTAKLILERAALAVAHQNNLVAEDGSIICWACRDREALLPSLHCGRCLGAHYAKHSITMPECINREQRQAEKVPLPGRKLTAAEIDAEMGVGG